MSDYFSDDEAVTFDDGLDEDDFCAECGWSFGDHDPQCSVIVNSDMTDEEYDYALDCE